MTTTSTAWERSLLDRIEVGDDSALAAAYDRFGALVYGLATRMVGSDHAADICQDVFVTLWEHPDRIDHERGSMRSFLATVARRRCIDHLRRQSRRSANERRAHHVDVAPSSDVGEAALITLAARQLRQAVEALPAEQRVAIQLAYFGGLTFREVAVATGTREGTAKSRIRLGLKQLAGRIGRDEDMETT